MLIPVALLLALLQPIPPRGSPPVVPAVAAVAGLAMSAQAVELSRNTGRVTVVVLDPQGLPIVGAQITLIERQGRVRRSAASSADSFQFVDLPATTYDLRVEADGFETQSLVVDLTERLVVTLDVRLTIARVGQDVVVTATRTERPLEDVPASVNVLGRDDIRRSPAIVADDVLRTIPSFSLFRRASSIALHPTSQGVSLRGLGPSGVSRTLVLLDNVPFNDPFGGWVYWSRVPLESTERIEVVDSASSSLYGNYAIGGVINIVTATPARRTIELKPQFGNRTTPKLDFFGSDVWGRLGVAVEGSILDTDGYPIVAQAERGPIDLNADVNYKNVSAKAEYRATDRMTTFFRGGYFTEDRTNGKVGEVNDTIWKYASGGVRFRTPGGSDFQARVFGDVQRFHSTFLAVSAASTTIPARSLVRLSTDQRVPTHSAGGMLQWSRPIGGSHVVGAGADWRWVDGDSQEDSYNAAVPTVIVPPVTIRPVLAVQRVSGGTQRSLGVFVQDILTPLPRLTVTLSARVDRWKNYDAHNFETTVSTGLPTVSNRPSLPDKNDTVVSPRLAAIYHLTDSVNAWGDFGLAFRAPTLNELYRQFSVGALLTRPNDQLGPERLKGGEIGFNLTPVRNMSVRTTWFDNRVRNPVSNVTIGANLQQRQNLGRTRVWGLQTDVEYRLGSLWRLSGGYLFDQAKVVESSANPALVNNCNGQAGEACDVPQVPAHRGSFQITYSHPRQITLTAAVQFVGRQFDDDQNVRGVPPATLVDEGFAASSAPGLPRYALVDLTASRSLHRNLDLFVGVQNLLDRVYFVGTNPTLTGSPRLINGGVRLRLAGR